MSFLRWLLRSPETSVAAGSLLFYTLHIILRNNFIEPRRQLIMNGCTVDRFLPTSIQSANSFSSVNTDLRSKLEKITELKAFEALPDRFWFALNPLGEKAEKLIAASTNHNKQFLAYQLYNFYTSDLPET